MIRRIPWLALAFALITAGCAPKEAAAPVAEPAPEPPKIAEAASETPKVEAPVPETPKEEPAPKPEPAPTPEPPKAEPPTPAPEPPKAEPAPVPEPPPEPPKAEVPPPAPVPIPEVHECTLTNGMRFLLVRRPDAPVFRGEVGFRVGGVDDPSGITGMAHMFEHMAFKGTKTIGTADWGKEKPILDRIEKVGGEWTALRCKGGDPAKVAALQKELGDLHAQLHQVMRQNEFNQLYAEAGNYGLNASTSQDWTRYFVSLPKNRLELWMLMESERLRDPVLREFYLERNVVAEERRMRTETSPGGLLWESLVTTAYMAHPYGRPTIGWMSDIQGLTLDRAREFYQRHYSPENAVGVLVGDIDLPQARQLLERYFGRIPRRESAPETATVEPPQRGERRVEVVFDAAPQLLMAFHKPCAPSPDDTAADLLSGILGDGPTSRLHRRLVLKDRIAAAAGAGNGAPGGRYDNLFIVSATPLKGHSAAECEAAVEDEIARLAREPVSAEELARVRTKEEVGLLREMATNESLSDLLCSNAVIVGDWREPWHFLDRMRAVTPEHLQAFAAKYLVKENRTVATLVSP